MTYSSWRPIFYASTLADSDADTDGILYIDIPSDREYKILSLKCQFERDSDITYGAAEAPALDIVTSTAVHGNTTERLLGRYTQVATMTADTVANNVFWQTVIPAGDTYAGVAIATQNFYIPIPSDLILSTMHRMKIWSPTSTGGEYRIMDLEGHFLIRDNKGRRA